MGGLRSLVGGALSRVGLAARVMGRGLVLTPPYLAHILWAMKADFIVLMNSAYKGNAVVYATVTFLAQALCEPPLLVYKRQTDGTKGEKLGWKKPAQTLLENPNVILSQYQYIWLIVHHLVTVGAARIFIEESVTGEPLALWPLRPDRVSPIYSSPTDYPVKPVQIGWSYRVPDSGTYIDIAMEQMVPITLPDPAGASGGMVEGVGPLQVLAKEISADNLATDFVGNIIQNYAQPGVVLSIDRILPNEDAANRIKQGFVADYGGRHKGMPAILEKGLKVDQLGFSLQQLEFSNVRDLSETRIAAAIGPAAVLVGLLAGMKNSHTNATIRELRSLMTQTTCTTYWRLISDAHTKHLGPHYAEDLIYLFDMSKVRALRMDELDRVEIAFANGVLAVNQYLEALGYPDNDEIGDMYFQGEAPGRGVGSPTTWGTVPATTGGNGATGLPGQQPLDDMNTPPREFAQPVVARSAHRSGTLVRRVDRSFPVGGGLSMDREAVNGPERGSSES